MPLLLYLLSFQLTAIFCSGTIIISEQFNTHPTYFEYDYEIDGHNLSPILFEEFNTQPNYFSIYHENEGGTNTQLETSVSNGVLNILTDGQSQDIEIEMSYPVSSSDTESGILYFTVEVGNSAEVTDGGTFIDSDGDVEAINQAVAWLSLNNFNGSVDEIALQNHNGVKRITYGDNDNYFNVSNFDKMYLRLSYDFDSNIFKQYYSTDGIDFTEIFSSYASDDSFTVTIGAESNNVAFNPGEVYFDNFIISDSPTYISANDLEAITSNGVLNIKGGSGPGERQVILSLPVSSSMTTTGSLFFTVLANNTTNVPNGGTFTDDDGDIRPFHQAKSGILFGGFFGDGGIEMTNDNGSKSIIISSDEYSPDPDDDPYLDVGAFENIYLRCSYNFNTGISSKSYSTDGITFIHLYNEYAPNNDNFIIELFVETQNIDLEEGEIYFDNFVIADDTTYDYTLSDNPYSGSSSGTNTIILKTYKSNDMQTWELIEAKEIESDTPLFLKSEIVTE